MEIYNQFIKLENISLALGFFDGVHLGHQAVIKSAVENIQKNKSAVITFINSPAEFFGADCKYISTLNERRELIRTLGVDYLFEIEFTEEISKITGKEYIEQLVKYFSPSTITTGFNHTFGKNKSGTPALLANLQEKYNYTYHQIQPQKLNNEVISSTKIKELLSKGNIDTANKMLGYNFNIKEKVVHGNHLGNKIGFPTANIEYPQEKIQLPYGVYATRIQNHKAITNFGIKPTVSNDKLPIVESHILNFEENIYNKDIEIEFIQKIRDEKKFDSLEDLIEQIKKDKAQCLKL